MGILPVLSLAIAVSATFTASGAARILHLDDEQNNKQMVQVQNHGPSLSIDNQVQRLQKRLENRFGIKPSAYNVKLALLARRSFLSHRVDVAFSGMTGMHAAPSWTASLAQHPEWLVFDPNGVTFGIDEAQVVSSFDTEYPAGIQRATHATVTSTYDDKGVEHAVIEGTAQDGYVLDTLAAAKNIAEAFAKQQDSVVLPLTFQKGTISKDGQALTLLASGMSEYSHSPWGRIQNIKKEVRERLNGSIAKQGEVFSFNETFGGPVSKSNGWYDSLIIVNGKDLEPAPGGGICQAATTTYRAAVLAGLPIVARNNHSLYVTHYKKYGLGIDATVFPKKQDMSFVNDTPADIIILSSMDEEKEEVTVKFYGIDDGRTVALEGPYLGPTAPSWLKVNGRAVRNNEVAWSQKITYPDGRVVDNVIVSDFVGLPYHKLSQEFPTSVGVADLMPKQEVPANAVAENF